MQKITMSPENTETLRKGHESPPFQGDISYYGHPWSFSAQSLELKYTNNGKPTNTDSESDAAINYEKVALSSECCARAAWLENYYNYCAAVCPYLLKAQPRPQDGWFYPSSHGYYIDSRWCPQLPVQMVVPQIYHPKYNFQEFQYFVVIDFEATCDKERNPHPQEIIEFPSVLVNSRTGQLEHFFQVYVRPTHNQQLTDFCKDLTGIQQSQVDKGILLDEALLKHDNWLKDKGVMNTNFAVVTWSNWDCRVMLESECRFKRIKKPQYFDRWINLKIPYSKVFGDSKCNLREAVERAGLTWEGRAHCGLDDAKNTARLLAHLMARGSKLSITNKLQWQSADHPTTVPVNAETPYKWNNPAYFTTAIPQQIGPIKDPHCYCGAACVKWVNQKPGPERGSLFFGCGNCTATGPACNFFKPAAATVTVAAPVKAG